jgi:DNA uptake protein ComE-like DNA-binding protein
MKWLRLFAALGAFLVPNICARGPWVTLTDCRYVPDDSNDGDSFHVKARDKEYVFRLYFVDAPEISSVNAPRLVEQAKYFGITVPQAIELGRTADSYVRDRLAKPFAVVTHFAHSPSRGKVERFYAFVQNTDGDLGEQLVAEGFARIYGTTATPPGLVTSAAEGAELKRLENEAKEKQAGGWSTKREQLIVRDEKSQENNPSKSVSSDSRKEDVKAATENSTPHKLDVNRATRKQLEDLPGVGPVLAARIIAARPLNSADDLLHVDGIGRKKYAVIRPYFD